MESAVHVGARFDRLPITPWFGRVMAVIIVGGIVDYYSINAAARVLPMLISQFHLTHFQTSVLSASVFMGMAPGAISAGYLGDKFGRRRLLLILFAVVAVGSLISTVCTDYTTLILSRMMTGFGGGGGLIMVWTYSVELFPTRKRGFLAILPNVFSTLGANSIYAFLDAWFVTFGPIGWRYAFLLDTVTVAIAIPLLLLAPESPRYFEVTGQTAKANSIMDKIESAIQKQYGRPLPPVDLSVDVIIPEKFPFRDIFSKLYARRTALATCCWVFQTFSFIAFNQFMPTIFVAQGFTLTSSLMWFGVSGAVGLAGGLVATAYAERIQRRWVMVIGGLLSGACTFMLPFTVYPAIAVIVAIYGFVAAFWTNTINMYTAEIFPTRARTTGVGFANGLGRFSSVLMPFTLVPILAANPTDAWLFVGGWWLICGLSVAILGVNTNKLRLEKLSR